VVLSVLLFVLIFVVIAMVIKNNINAFAQEFPKYEQRIDVLTHDLIELLQIKGDQGAAESGRLPTGLSATLEGFSLSKMITGVVSSIGNFISNTILVLLFLLFLLAGRNTLVPKIEQAFPGPASVKVVAVISNINPYMQVLIIPVRLPSCFQVLSAVDISDNNIL